MSTSPLSRAQRGLWFLHRLRPESAAYNLATAARVLGARPAAEIRAFFQGMVDRHAVLRATFHREGEEPVQRVHASVEVAFAEIDARGWTEREVRAAIEDALRRIAASGVAYVHAPRAAVGGPEGVKEGANYVLPGDEKAKP